MSNPKLQAHSLLAWVVGNGLQDAKGNEIEFIHSPWLVSIYEDTADTMCIIKSSQARISTYAIFYALHFAIHHRVTVIFTEPTRDDAQKFSTSRVTPMVDTSAYLRSLVEGGTELRKIRQYPGGPIRSHIHFRGTFGEKEAFTVDSDLNIIDELDMSNQTTVSTFDTRLVASQFKRKRYISTPSIPNYGIDSKWRISDQHQWLWRCDGCGKEINPREDYYKIIDRERLLFRCYHCGKPINRGKGRWVPAKPQSGLMRGYAITQPICLYVPVRDIVEAELTKRPRAFANYWLGIPSEEGVGKVGREIIEQKCFLSGHARSLSAVGARRVMGVDQGDYLYCEVAELGPPLGEREGVEDHRSHIVELYRTRNWADLYELMQRHEIEVCVIDARPEFRLARQFAQAFPGRVFYAEHAEIKEPVRWHASATERYYIQYDRTQCLDAAAENIMAGITQLYVPKDDYIDQECIGEQPGGWIQHWENQHRVEPEEPDGKVTWRETGPDHWTFADVYRLIAESRVRGKPVNTVWAATAGRRLFATETIEREEPLSALPTGALTAPEGEEEEEVLRSVRMGHVKRVPVRRA